MGRRGELRLLSRFAGGGGCRVRRGRHSAGGGRPPAGGPGLGPRSPGGCPLCARGGGRGGLGDVRAALSRGARDRHLGALRHRERYPRAGGAFEESTCSFWPPSARTRRRRRECPALCRGGAAGHRACRPGRDRPGHHGAPGTLCGAGRCGGGRDAPPGQPVHPGSSSGMRPPIGSPTGPPWARRQTGVRSQTLELGRGSTARWPLTRQPLILDDYQASPYACPNSPTWWRPSPPPSCSGIGCSESCIPIRPSREAFHAKRLAPPPDAGHPGGHCHRERPPL